MPNGKHSVQIYAREILILTDETSRDLPHRLRKDSPVKPGAE